MGHREIWQCGKEGLPMGLWKEGWSLTLWSWMNLKVPVSFNFPLAKGSQFTGCSPSVWCGSCTTAVPGTGRLKISWKAKQQQRMEKPSHRIIYRGANSLRSLAGRITPKYILLSSNSCSPVINLLLTLLQAALAVATDVGWRAPASTNKKRRRNISCR